MTIVNQYSFLIVALLSLIALGLFLLRDGLTGSDAISLAALLIGFGIAFVLLSPGKSAVAGLKKIEEAIGSGTPVLLEYQSPY
jgi:hypothetical protein